ncbi:MAG: TldD/PmbA family protein [Methanomassiliicoccales archaeon]|nr:TldD/PmbA family protein [Methanomassiliicoccales archaeon]
MKTDEICDTAISSCLKLGANDVVVTVMKKEESMVRFANDQVTVVNSLDELSASIFLCVGRRKAALNVVDLDKKGLEKACQQAVRIASNMPEASLYAPLPKGPFNYDRKLTERETVPAGPDQAVHWVQESISAAKKAGASRTAGSLTARNVTVHLATSGGAAGVTVHPSLELSIRAFGEGLASGHSLSVSVGEKGFDPSAAGREAGELAKAAKGPKKGEPGTMDAVLGPMVFADLIGEMGRFSSAFYVDAGMSFLTGKIGEQVASPKLDLYDDATDPTSVGASPFDSEGLPTRRKALIEKGVLRTHLHNSATAAKFGVNSTANAGLIAPRPFCLQVGAGEKDVEDIISQVDKGVYVTNDWYLRYQNYSTGDLSTIPRDALFLIEKGEITASLKELRISDNILGMMKRIEALSRQRKWVKWWEVDVPTLVPTALVTGTRFTASSQ